MTKKNHVTTGPQTKTKMASMSSGAAGLCKDFDVVRDLVAAQLKKDGVQLWLAPYTREDTGEIGEFPDKLVERYSTLFKIPPDNVASIVETLRENAVKKLRANLKFKACGVASIKVKFVDKACSGLQNNEMIETGLHITGWDLKQKIKIKVNVEEDVKLICHGKIITDDKTLAEQGVRNHSLVMVIISHKEDMVIEETMVNQVARTKHAASVLANKKQGKGPYENYYLEISDQNGKPLTLPDAERKSLVLAMSLHEQGKTILKKRKFSEALVVLLEADKEYSQCRSEVLNAVDNYAILCLDVVWCYLQLKSIKELPGAEKMLKNCEVCLKKSYGEHLERLVSLTGGSAKEKVLYVRLYLLQAICAFHKGGVAQSSVLLDKVEKEIQSLKVDDITLSQMLSMGFSASESRLALRACHGDITTAVGYISRKREEKEQQKQERREKNKKQKLARKLGKTVNGEWVNVDVFNTLREMGFPEDTARKSLRLANNDMNTALQLLQEKPELLIFSDSDSTDTDMESLDDVPDDVVAQVTAMGFDVSIARSVLQYHHGNISRTIDKLLECGGTLPPECETSKESRDINGEGSSDQWMTSSEDEREVEEALKEMSGAFDEEENEESHLDLTLEEEANFVTEYRTMIATIAQIENK